MECRGTLAGTAAVGAKALLNGEKVASEGRVKALTEAAEQKEAEEILVEGVGKSTGKFVIGKRSHNGTGRRGSGIAFAVGSAGVEPAAGFGETISSAVRIAKTYPFAPGQRQRRFFG